MGRQELIKRLVREDLEKYEKLRTRLESEYKVLPRGSLIRRSNGGISISLREDGKQYQVALSPEDELITQLKKKRYIKAGRLPIADWIDACKYLLSKESEYDPVKIELQLPPQYAGLEGIDIFPEGDVNPYEWKLSSTEDSQFHSENLIHQTNSGIRMRSKSEVMIGTALERRNIPYKYEEQINCGRYMLVPDFEILHPELHRIVCLEHFGMLDNPQYARRSLEKLQLYAQNGIVLGYNLFITYESKDDPLTTADINKVIDEIMALEF